MALYDQLQAINQIAEALNSCERRRLFYLCEVLDADTSVVCMKEMLKHKVMHHDTGHHLLMELMVRLRRFDILRKVCKSSRDEMERTLSRKQLLPRFRVLMANISEDMANEDLNSVKFLLSNTLPREQLEKVKSFLDVVIELEKLDKVSSERVELVEECLANIGRLDLAKKVSAYKMTAVTSEHPSPQQRSRDPSSFPTPTSQLQHLGHGKPLHCVTEHMPISTYRGQSCKNELDFYKFSTNPRGVCVIIDCVGNDGDLLEQTFKALHFDVVLYKWLSVDDVLSALRGTLRRRESLEAAVCCIISRGTVNHLLGTDSYGVGLHLDKVRRTFTADAYQVLAGKPKLFFIQRYSIPEIQPCANRDHRDEDLETDGCDGAATYGVIPEDADVFWSHCWTDERQLEQGHHCSVYLKALTDALLKGQRRKTHLIDLHTEVNRAICEHNKSVPGAKYHVSLKHTLRKCVYLQ